MGRNEVTQADVREVCAGWITGQIFDLTDAIAQRDTDRALRVYAELLSQREPAQRISFLIIRQLNLMLQAGELSDNGVRGQELASRLSLHPYVAGKYVSWAAGFGRERLRKLLELAVSQDEEVKTGRLDGGLAAELLIVQASRQ